jgi:hypothetical protein
MHHERNHVRHRHDPCAKSLTRLGAHVPEGAAASTRSRSRARSSRCRSLPRCQASRGPRLRRGTASHITTCLTAPPRPAGRAIRLGSRPTSVREARSQMRHPSAMIRKRRPEAAIDLRTDGPARLSSVHTLPAIHTTATRRLEHSHPERYVARAELARIMGVSVATVDRMVVEGMPSVTWGRRTRRFKPSAAIDWAKARGSA